jgi:hypothetical protein
MLLRVKVKHLLLSQFLVENYDKICILLREKGLRAGKQEWDGKLPYLESWLNKVKHLFLLQFSINLDKNISSL